MIKNKRKKIRGNFIFKIKCNFNQKINLIKYFNKKIEDNHKITIKKTISNLNQTKNKINDNNIMIEKKIFIEKKKLEKETSKNKNG